MKLLNKVFRRSSDWMTHLARARAREVLLKSSDRMLADAGFSRELLESGVKAWPWHASDDALAPLSFKHIGNDAGMRALDTYSDRELNSLGIVTGVIPARMTERREDSHAVNEDQVA